MRNQCIWEFQSTAKAERVNTVLGIAIIYRIFPVYVYLGIKLQFKIKIVLPFTFMCRSEKKNLPSDIAIICCSMRITRITHLGSDVDDSAISENMEIYLDFIIILTLLVTFFAD